MTAQRVEDGWHRAVIALGSNLGQRDEEIFRARADIRATEGIRVVAASSVHETVALTPSGYDEHAPRYLNQVVLVDTVWTPEKLLEITQEIEARHGRERSEERYAPRTLDIDLISYDDLEKSGDDLQLPHPRAHERSFVLAPWFEIDPDAVLPGKGAIRELLQKLETTP